MGKGKNGGPKGRVPSKGKPTASAIDPDFNELVERLGKLQNASLEELLQALPDIIKLKGGVTPFYNAIGIIEQSESLPEIPDKIKSLISAIERMDPAQIADKILVKKCTKFYNAIMELLSDAERKDTNLRAAIEDEKNANKKKNK